MEASDNIPGCCITATMARISEWSIACRVSLHSEQYRVRFSSNDVLELEIDAGNSQFAANDSSKAAFETLIDGDQWMIYRNVLTGTLHWDFVSTFHQPEAFDELLNNPSRALFRVSSPSL